MKASFGSPLPLFFLACLAGCPGPETMDDGSVPRDAGGDARADAPGTDAPEALDVGMTDATELDAPPDLDAPSDAFVPGCTVPGDCAGTDDECGMRTCVAGTCGMAFTDSGTALSVQEPGDCRRVVCDGAGGTMIADDAADLPDDANACTIDLCDRSDPIHQPVDMGTVVGDPTVGDCLHDACDGEGMATSAPNDADLPVDGDPCTMDVCTAGVASHPPAALGTACSTGVCDGAGACVAAPRGVVVVRVGDGAAALSSAATPVFLQHLALDGTPGAVVALPTVASGVSQPFGLSGTATSEGHMTRSTDGHYLVLAGYAATPGTAAISSTTSAAVNRVVARVDALGNVDTSTRLDAAFSGSSVRSAATTDGSTLWVGGTGSAPAGGAWSIPFGATGGTQILAAPANLRVVSIYGGQLYGTSGSTPFVGVFTIGTGLPGMAGQTATPLPGMVGATGPSPYGFVAFDASSTVPGVDLLYVADDRSAASGGGIQRWTFDGITWTLATTFNLGSGARGVAAYRVGASTVVYAVTTGSAVVTLVDDGASSPVPSMVFDAPSRTALRGIALAPE